MITAGLEAFAVQLAAATGMTVTRDPSLLFPPCLFIDVPAVTGRTQGATTVEVPVRFIVPGPGDLAAHDALTNGIETVLDACGANTATPEPFGNSGPDGVLYPSLTVLTTLTITRS